MTPRTASKIVLTFALGVFVSLFFFNLGRMTASTVTLRSGCDLTTYDRSGLKPAWYRGNR